MNVRIGTMLRNEILPHNEEGVDRNMRTLRFGLQAALATLVTVAAISQLLGVPSHGFVDIIAAATGFVAVTVIRVFHLFGA